MDEIEEIILKRELYDGFDTEYINLLLKSAILSRELELAPSTIRNKFVRAEESCKRYGTMPQLYEIIYQQGLTEFYWLENPLGTMGFLLKLKPLLDEEVNVTRIEKYITLFNVMENAQVSELFNDEESLKNEIEYQNMLLQKLENDSSHKSSYLYLKFSLLERQLIYGSREEEEINQVLAQITSVLDEATNHIDIPFESLCQIIEMAGAAIDNNEAYEDLVDMLFETLSKHQQDITAAEVQMKRGLQNLEKGEAVQAIRHLGQCVDLFSKESTKKDYVVACSYLGMAFMHQDLLYAAKVMFVKSAAMLLHDVELNGNPDHLTITILSQLCCVGLRSGRIIDFLLSLELRDIIAKFNPDFEDESFWKNRGKDETSLSIRLLAGSVSESEYGELPAIFERIGLQGPKDVLLFRLGYKDLISDEFKEVIKEDDNWMKTLRKQTENDFFLFANTIADKETKLETVVKGCRIIADFESDCQLQVYAELLLAFFESLFATATFKDFMFTTPSIHFRLKKKTEGGSEIIPESNRDEYVFKVNTNTIDNKEAWQVYSLFLGQLFYRNALVPDMDKVFDDKQTKEKILNRLSVMMTYRNDIRVLYGDDYKNTLSKWASPSDEFYVFKGSDDLSTPFEENRGKQAEITIKSIINNPLWDKALWSGCGYIQLKDYSEPSILLLLFKDMEAGNKIFDEWRVLYEKGCLNMRLAFIQHVDRDHPTWYKVIVSQDINNIRKEKVGQFVLQSERIHTMKPDTSSNIDLFKSLYKKFGLCKLSSVQIDDNQQMVLDNPQQRCPFLLPVKNIVFREAWEIGKDDQDSSAILVDDNPFVPAEREKDAPVLELLKSKRKDML